MAEPSARSLEVSETIPEADEEKDARNDTEDQTWRQSLSQLPPFAFVQPSSIDAHLLREWKPKCNHSTMTRLFNPNYTCESCGEPGDFGWLYRCTVDREPLIVQNKEKGLPYAFDPLGQSLAETMTLGKRGPEARADKLSFLKEMTKEQLDTYTPEQLVIISKQRENVAAKIEESRKPGRGKYPYQDRPWMPSPEYECQYKICQACHRFGKDKSFVSLDAIANDEVPPTVATAYGFSHLGYRQMSNAIVVRNIGCRAVPLPRAHPARRGLDMNSLLARLRRLHDEQKDAERSTLSTDISASTLSTESEMAIENFPPRGSLRRSSHFPDLRFSRSTQTDPFVTNAVDCITKRVPLVITITKQPYFDSSGDFKQESSDHDEDAITIPHVEESSRQFPSLDSAIADVNAIDTGHDSGVNPLRETEVRSDGSANGAHQAEVCEDTEGSFTQETLSAGSGVALTEEAADLGTPDIIAH